jgi:hypothetical protein
MMNPNTQRATKPVGSGANQVQAQVDHMGNTEYVVPAAGGAPVLNPAYTPAHIMRDDKGQPIAQEPPRVGW